MRDKGEYGLLADSEESTPKGAARSGRVDI
jgi:hypothetical protein